MYRFEIEDKKSSSTFGYFIGIGRFELGDIDFEIYNILDKLTEGLVAPDICKDKNYDTVSYYTELGYKKYKRYLLKLSKLINKYFDGNFEMKRIEIKEDYINGNKVYEDDLQVAYIKEK